MRHFYLISEDQDLKIHLDQTYDEILQLVKKRNPKTDQLSDDEELSKLHDLYSLLRSGKIKISYDVMSGVRTLEINIVSYTDKRPGPYVCGG